MDDVIRLLKTLADPTRLRLLRLLALEELTVGELAEVTGLAQSRVSNHLRILREEELLVERREGAWHFYAKADTVPAAAASLWPTLEAEWRGAAFYPDDLEHLKRVLAARSSRSQAFFERVAGEWDAIRAEMFGDTLAREILRALLPPGLVVADFGTGTGYVVELFGDRAERIIAIDSSESMLKVARLKATRAGRTNVEFRRGDAHDPPLKAGEVDVAVFCMVLHHVADPGAAIEAAARAMQPDGQLLIADFAEHRQEWLQHHMEHQWLGFSRRRVEGWLEDAGLAPCAWVSVPGRSYTTPEGRKLQVPDAFLSVSSVMPLPMPRPKKPRKRAAARPRN